MEYDVCVVGGCSLDQIFFKDSNGNYSNKPDVSLPGGKASNQAVAASRAGSNVTIITRLGKDEIGRQILTNLKENNIDTSNVEIVENLINDITNIYIDQKNKDNYKKRRNSLINTYTSDMIKKYKDVILKSKVVVAQTKTPEEFTIALINFCYENSIPIVITPSIPSFIRKNKKMIEKINLITCNKKECETIFDTKDIKECVKQYPNKLIVTLGSEGVIYNDGEKTIKLPAPKISIIEDTTGAGDTFNGNLVSFLLQGENLYDSICKAQFASSMKLMKKGAQDGMPYKKDLENYINSYNKNI